MDLNDWIEVCPVFLGSFKLEGWLWIPEKNKKERKKKVMEWKKQYVVVSSRKIFFYKSDLDKKSGQPVMILDIRLVVVSVFKRPRFEWIIAELYILHKYYSWKVASSLDVAVHLCRPWSKA